MRSRRSTLGLRVGKTVRTTAWEREISRAGKGGTYIFSDVSLLEGGNVRGGVWDGEIAGMAGGLASISRRRHGNGNENDGQKVQILRLKGSHRGS